MIYVMSDIHGCYEEFRELLEKINFSEEDTLYILGDMLDRGPQPVKLILDLMCRPNVFPILGNHDYMALVLLKKLDQDITPDKIDTVLTKEVYQSYLHWLNDGGNVTARQYRKLPDDIKEYFLDYLQDCSLYEVVTVNGKTFVLTHADIHGHNDHRALSDHDFKDFLFYRADYNRRYFNNPDTYLVTGHTPTCLIREDLKPLIYEENGHIAIDCGCIHGGNLAAYCLDTGEKFYVKRKSTK